MSNHTVLHCQIAGIFLKTMALSFQLIRDYVNFYNLILKVFFK